MPGRTARHCWKETADMDELLEKIEEVLDGEIRPQLLLHGGGLVARRGGPEQRRHALRLAERRRVRDCRERGRDCCHSCWC